MLVLCNGFNKTFLWNVEFAECKRCLSNYLVNLAYNDCFYHTELKSKWFVCVYVVEKRDYYHGKQNYNEQ